MTPAAARALGRVFCIVLGGAQRPPPDYRRRVRCWLIRIALPMTWPANGARLAPLNAMTGSSTARGCADLRLSQYSSTVIQAADNSSTVALDEKIPASPPGFGYRVMILEPMRPRPRPPSPRF